MLKPKIAFVVFGVHKDGLKDPMGNEFIDYAIIEKSKEVLRQNGLELRDTDLIVSTKEEAKKAIYSVKNEDSIDSLVLFAGTWAWSAHLVASIRAFAKTGKGIVIWTHSGSQGWRTVGGLVLTASLKEVGIKHKFVYGSYDNQQEVDIIVDYCKASALKNSLEMSTIASFGGRGMGQTCGVADPSQWMKTFGIDIDSRDTIELLERAKKISQDKVEFEYRSIGKKFNHLPEKDEITNKSIRLYLALKEIIKENKYSFYTLQSFPGLADHYVATCFAQSMMLEDGVPTSTLSDFNTAMTCILLTYLSKEKVYYGDLQHINKEKKEIKIIGDGAVPPSLANGDGASFAEHGIPTEGGAGGLSVQLVCKNGKGVLARLGRENGCFKMVLAKCEIVEPDNNEIEARRAECGIPFWPHAFVKVSGDIEVLLENWNSEYACLGYGEELYQQLTFFCELVGIEVVHV